MSYGEGPVHEIVQDAINEMKKREFKNLVKDAIKEWLDEQSVKVGKWSLRFIAMMILGALTYFILTQNGWSK